MTEVPRVAREGACQDQALRFSPRTRALASFEEPELRFRTWRTILIFEALARDDGFLLLSFPAALSQTLLCALSFWGERERQNEKKN